MVDDRIVPGGYCKAFVGGGQVKNCACPCLLMCLRLSAVVALALPGEMGRCPGSVGARGVVAADEVPAARNHMQGEQHHACKLEFAHSTHVDPNVVFPLAEKSKYLHQVSMATAPSQSDPFNEANRERTTRRNEMQQAVT